jgi:hypothetical protein
MHPTAKLFMMTCPKLKLFLVLFLKVLDLTAQSRRNFGPNDIPGMQINPSYTLWRANSSQQRAKLVLNATLKAEFGPNYIVKQKIDLDNEQNLTYQHIRSQNSPNYTL